MIFLGKNVRPFGEPFIVAEISGNHCGDLSIACNLIVAAKEAGADAVKFQCYEADDLTVKNGYVIGGGTPWEGQTLHGLYEQACTPLNWMRPLFDEARRNNIPAFSSVYSSRGLRVLEEVGCPAYKIASYENNDLELIQQVVNTGKPIVISMGMISEDEENRLMGIVDKEKTILLHCISKYPVELDELGFQTMVDMAHYHRGIPIGFSCHTDNPLAMAAAVTLGAAMVEIHLTLYMLNAPDYEFSYLPDQLEQAINWTRAIARSRSYHQHTLEKPAREFRRSLFLVKDIEKGEIFTHDHVKSFRPAQGCSPHLLPNIIGRKANQTLKAYTPMQMEYVE